MVRDPATGTPETTASLCNQINRDRFPSAEQPESAQEDIWAQLKKGQAIRRAESPGS